LKRFVNEGSLLCRNVLQGGLEEQGEHGMAEQVSVKHLWFRSVPYGHLSSVAFNPNGEQLE
jgi:hypothetical protein